jgi:hypothetical protein
MEILEQQQSPQQTPQHAVTTGRATQVLCPLNLNMRGFGALLNSNNCKRCEHFCGVIEYPTITILPRLTCKATGNIKLLEFYTNCYRDNRNVKCSRYCKKCSIYFKNIDTSTGYVNCVIGKSKERITQLFPKKQLNVHYPFQIPCAKTGNTGTIESCVKCQFWKGIYKSGYSTKICCTHSKARQSEFVLRRFNKPKTKPRTKTLHTPCLRWLFEENIKTQRVKIIVCCTLQVNCLLEKPLKNCRDCVDHDGVTSDFKIQCKTFLRPLVFVQCCHSKGSVLLQTCVRCSEFQGIKNESVQCSYTGLCGYVSNPPKQSKEISKLTHKKKFYYDVPD